MPRLDGRYEYDRRKEREGTGKRGDVTGEVR
jgi:hypothetical protein